MNPYLIRKISTAVRNARIDLSRDPLLYEIGDFAYRRCLQWFGPVKDDLWRYEIDRASRTAMSRDPFRRCYIILVDREYHTYEQCCESIGHEMYHRVTFAKQGLRRQLWVDEMLASLAAYHVLREFGYSSYANFLVAYHFEEVSGLEIHALHQVHRRPWVPVFLQPYPEGFGTGVFRVGIKLERIIGWDNICRIISCSTWDQWFSTIPDSTRAAVFDLLFPTGA